MIFLDIDDTLVDHSKAERVAATKFGIQFRNELPSYDQEMFFEEWHREAERQIQAFLTGTISFQEQRRRRIRGVFNDDSISNNQADEIFAHFLRHYEDGWEIFPDVIPFLENNNRSGGLAALSDGAQHQQEQKLEQTGISHFFRFVITAESTGLSKPNPAFFVKACALAGSEPAGTFYIGDNIRKDAVGASHAGLNGVWLNRKRNNAEFEVYSIESLTDFMPVKALQWTRMNRANEF